MKTSLSLIFTLGLLICSAQNTFQETYGGGGAEGGHSLQVTSTGDFICLGYRTTFASTDIYLLKADAEGNELWNLPIGTDNDESGHAIQETTDGGYILCGRYDWFNDSLALIRTTVDGDVIWSKRFSGSAERSVGHAVLQTSDGGFLAAGYTGAGLMEDIYLLKTDEDGNEEWSQVHASAGREFAYSVQELSDGYIIAGLTDAVGAGGLDIYLMRTDEMGEILWTQTFGGEPDEIGNSVELTDDGGFIIVGQHGIIGGNKVILIKTDDQGNEEWIQEFDYDNWVSAHDVKQTSDGGYVIGGTKENTDDESFHMHCIRTDGSGNLMWENSYPRGHDSNAQSIALTDDGGIVLLGSSLVTQTDVSSNRQMYLVKTTADGVLGLPEESSLDDIVDVYPNPVYGWLNVLRFDQSIRAVLLRDVHGREVMRHELHSDLTTIDLSRLTSGLYQMVILTNDGPKRWREPILKIQ